VLAVAALSVCIVLVARTTLAATSPTSDAIDTTLSAIVTISILVAGALLVLAQVLAGRHAATAIRPAGPASRAPGLRARRPGVAAAFAALIVIIVTGTIPQPRSAVEAAWLVGLATVSLVLDAVGARWLHRHGSRGHAQPGASSRLRIDAANSASISRVLGSVLLIPLAATIYQVISTRAGPATAVLQIGVGTLAVAMAFVLARVLQALSRCVDVDHAATSLWLAVGAATVVALAAYVAMVVRPDLDDGKVAMYRAVGTMLVLLIAVLNGAGLAAGASPATARRSRP